MNEMYLYFRSQHPTRHSLKGPVIFTTVVSKFLEQEVKLSGGMRAPEASVYLLDDDMNDMNLAPF